MSPCPLCLADPDAGEPHDAEVHDEYGDDLTDPVQGRCGWCDHHGYAHEVDDPLCPHLRST